MKILKWLFGTSKKEITPVIDTKKSLNRLQGSYSSYNDHYERIKRKDNSSSIVEDVVIGMAVNSIFDNTDSSPNYSSYDSDNSSSGFSSGFGGGDYSGGGSSGDWGSSDSSSSDYSSSND